MVTYPRKPKDDADTLKFIQICESYETQMLRHAYRILKNQHDAEDAVQDTYVSIAKNIKIIRCDNPAQIYCLLALIVEQRAINIIKSKYKYKLADMDASVYADDPDYTYELFPDEGNRVTDAVAKLSPRHRNVIMLRYYHNLKTKDIAKLTGTKQNSVQKLLNRAEKALAEILKKEGIMI